MGPDPKRSSGSGPGGEPLARFPCAPGLTLIEALVAIAIVAVLVAVASVGIARARETARIGASLANLRTHAQSFAAYAADNKNAHPWFTRLGFRSTVVVGGGLTIPNASYFDAHHTWHVALADAYYAGDARSPVFRTPRAGRQWYGLPHRTPYHYACVFIADPEFWDETRRVGPAQFRATRTDEVLFTATKALLSEDPEALPTPEPGRAFHVGLAAMCDGSARRISPSQAMSGYSRGDGRHTFFDAGAVHDSDSPPLLHTSFGLRGWDVR